MTIPDLSDLERWYFEIKIGILVTVCVTFGYWGRYTQEAFGKKDNHESARRRH